METRTHIRLWIGLFVLCLLLSPLIRKGESMERFVADEVRMTEATFGNTFGRWILGSVDTLFANSPAVVVNKVANAGVTSQDRKERLEKKLGKGVKGMADMANSYFTGIIQAAYIACIRLLIVIVWFGMLAPVLVASLIDGFAQRAIKQFQFGSIRPAAFSILAMVIVPFCFAPLLYLTIPVSIQPTIIPMWVFFGCLPLSMLIANTQPVFSKH